MKVPLGPGISAEGAVRQMHRSDSSEDTGRVSGIADGATQKDFARGGRNCGRYGKSRERKSGRPIRHDWTTRDGVKPGVILSAGVSRSRRMTDIFTLPPNCPAAFVSPLRGGWDSLSPS